MRPGDAQLLRQLGWPRADRAAVRDFQRGNALGPPLLVDGKVGARTRAALRVAADRGRRGLPNASDHFAWSEFRCRCGGQLRGCAVQRVHRDLLVALEAYRRAVGRGVTVVSGYRCPERNRHVGGAASSQHVHGAAADVKAALTPSQVLRLRAFSGLGTQRRSRRVVHVDVRHASGHNPTGGTVTRPTRWEYSSG